MELNNWTNYGLKDDEVINNRKKYGTNELVKGKSKSIYKLFLETLGDPIIKILLVALSIKVVLLFKDADYYETIGIVVAILLASFISTISEYGSERAFKKLQEESSKIKVKVRRNGCIKEIPVDEVVKGDIVILSLGDRIPADGYLIKGNISVDESSLNGESKDKKKRVLVDKTNIEEDNKLYRGSVVTFNDGEMVIKNVGLNTLYGKLAKEVSEGNSISPLKIRLTGLAKFISKIGYIGACLVFLSYLFSVLIIDNNFEMDKIILSIRDYPQLVGHILYALTLSVTIIVVSVPEGLPMMITLVLSSNMKKMLKDNVLVRKMTGIETSGSLNVLLTDKTGTLTKGKLEVTSIISGDNDIFYNQIEIEKYSKYYKCIEMSLVVNNASYYSYDGCVIGGNVTDKALLSFITKYNNNYKIINNVPFNSNNKYSMTLVNVDNSNVNLIKGSCESIMPYVKKYIDKNGNIKNRFNKDIIMREINNCTKKGNRVIVLAMKLNPKDYLDKNDLIFIGFVNIKDEIRKESSEGIRLIKEAGIDIKMITGDAKETAYSIAKELNIIENNKHIILTSEELNTLSDESIKNNFNDIKVIARALPNDKSRLVRIAKELDLVVGMTGDGVNDAPALKKADVGFAMGSGTEVSKEAADIVILDDNILSISKAILYGRTIFKSIRKFIVYQLTCNMCALVLSIVGPFLGINTPITIIQMLWINMIMDTFAGLAFSFEPPKSEYMKEKPKNKNEPIMNNYMFSEVLMTGLYSAILCLLFLKSPIFNSFIRTDNKYLMTSYFALFIFIDIFNAFNARTTRMNILANILKNKVFIITFGFIAFIQLYLIYNGGELFRTYGLNINELILVISLAFSVIPIDLLRKYLIKKRFILRNRFEYT